jgi:RHS repeat-associated protein
MQQRYQDPGAMRFLSVDPVHIEPGTGESFNQYRYANNSRYKVVDPEARLGEGAAER